jgi:hypothetical protein
MSQLEWKARKDKQEKEEQNNLVSIVLNLDISIF